MADQRMAEDQRVIKFIETVRPIFAEDISIEERLNKARPYFSDLLMADGWLPETYSCGDPNSGMGGGIGTWLLYRDEADTMCLFSLVVDNDKSTPVHDHLRWGLIGLYQGQQIERVYSRIDGTDQLRLDEEKVLNRGGIYDLIPPDGDIHGITTVSSEPSISIHLLGGDVGCIWRHKFDVDAGNAAPFRSGYSNAPCAEDTADLSDEFH